jgi:hypothetical protein
MGVDSIRDIPDDFELTEIQRRAANCVQTGEPWYSPELREVLDGLVYPLYFADFETVNPAIPPFGDAPLRPLTFSVVGACAATTGRGARAPRIPSNRCERSAPRVHHVAVRCVREKWQHRRVFLVRVSAPFRPCQFVS